MTRREPRADRPARMIRRDLADATLRIALAVDIDTVSVEVIAEAAGTSRSTFFRCFPTKYDALLQHVDASSEALLREARRTLAVAPELPWDGLRSACTVSLRDVLVRSGSMRELLSLVRGHAGLAAALASRVDAVRADLVDVLATAGVAGPHLLVRCALAARDAALDEWLADPTVDPVRTLALSTTRLGAALHS